MRRVALEDDVDEDRNEGVGALARAALDVAHETCRTRVPVSPVAQRAAGAAQVAGRTEDNLAAVEDADQLVSRRLVVVDLEKLCEIALRVSRCQSLVVREQVDEP